MDIIVIKLVVINKYVLIEIIYIYYDVYSL